MSDFIVFQKLQTNSQLADWNKAWCTKDLWIWVTGSQALLSVSHERPKKEINLNPYCACVPESGLETQTNLIKEEMHNVLSLQQVQTYSTVRFGISETKTKTFFIKYF